MSEESYEYGYRLSDGTEAWEIDYGTDGSWTSFDRARNIEAIVMDYGDPVTAIYTALDKAGVEGVAIRRLVARTTGPTETIDRPSPEEPHVV
jgi:hypothetical protein